MILYVPIRQINVIQATSIISMLGCGLCRVHGNVSNVGILFKYHDRLLSTEDCRPHMHDFVCVWCITMTLVWFINDTKARGFEWRKDRPISMYHHHKRSTE